MTDERDLVWGTTAEAARWLAETGLNGRFMFNMSWHRWDGTSWQPCDPEDVHQAVRLALEAVYDRRMGDDPPPTEKAALDRLLHVGWRLGSLMRALHRECAAVAAPTAGVPAS
jgi:hypothetical protein